MRFFKKILIFYFLINCLNTIGQYNIQTGYDYGTFTIPLTQRKGFNTLHRLNITYEYLFKKKIAISVNTGIDFHRINYNSNNISTNPTGGTSSEYFYSNKINLQNYRLGVSLGYHFNISDNSSIQLNVSYEQYFVNNVSIKESYSIKNSYNVPENEIDENEPTITTNEFSPRIDYQRFGYRNEFVKENRNIIFSLGYRYQFADYFISPSVGFSPLNTGFVLLRSQNLFLFGMNIGYTLPQKSKNNEK